MAQKAATKEKVTKGKKAAAPEKVTAKNRASKGETLVCQVCGLSVTVEEIGDIALVQGRYLLCCEEPMKAKASKTQAARKAKK